MKWSRTNNDETCESRLILTVFISLSKLQHLFNLQQHNNSNNNNSNSRTTIIQSSTNEWGKMNAAKITDDHLDKEKSMNTEPMHRYIVGCCLKDNKSIMKTTSVDKS